MPTLKKKRRKKQLSRKRTKVLRPLLNRAAEVPNAPASEPVKPEGVIGKLRGLFNNPQPVTGSPKPDVPASAKPFPTSEPAPLPADTERQLAAVPDVIGEERSSELVAIDDAGADLSNQARIGELVELGYVDAEQAGDIAGDIFDYLAVRFDSDHWKLKPNNRERIGRPFAASVNGAIQAVLDYLPDSASVIAAAHPEWAAFGLAIGGAIVPRALKQLKVSRERKRGNDRKPEQRTSKSAPSSGGIVPVMVGTIGK